jgi:hypothetical protein
MAEETVVFDDGTEATDGIAVYIPEEFDGE